MVPKPPMPMPGNKPPDWDNRGLWDAIDQIRNELWIGLDGHLCLTARLLLLEQAQEAAATAKSTLDQRRAGLIEKVLSGLIVGIGMGIVAMAVKCALIIWSALQLSSGVHP